MSKRFLDLIASLVGLVILSPLFFVIAILVKLQDNGPIFYFARRSGQNNQVFYMCKFRSMVVNAEQQGPAITGSEDSRITSIGKFLRKTKIDELPQLINVLVGEMSLVGPRPEDPRYVEKYTDEQRQILNYKPGITSAASLYYRYEESILDDDNWEERYLTEVMPRKLEIDIDYCRQSDIRQDISLIIRTIFAMTE